jgi:hypothetical protein
VVATYPGALLNRRRDRHLFWNRTPARTTADVCRLRIDRFRIVGSFANSEKVNQGVVDFYD